MEMSKRSSRASQGSGDTPAAPPPAPAPAPDAAAADIARRKKRLNEDMLSFVMRQPSPSRNRYLDKMTNFMKTQSNLSTSDLRRMVSARTLLERPGTSYGRKALFRQSEGAKPEENAPASPRGVRRRKRPGSEIDTLCGGLRKKRRNCCCTTRRRRSRSRSGCRRRRSRSKSKRCKRKCVIL